MGDEIYPVSFRNTWAWWDELKQQEARFAKEFWHGPDWEKKGMQCEYYGVRYRSALEARWAITMHMLDLECHYEPKTYRVGRERYVPDFWLPTPQHFLEIKPTAPNEAALKKAAMLTTHTGHRVFFLAEFPRIQQLTLTNSAVYWGDGLPVGPGMALDIKLMYVLGLPETPEARVQLVLAAQHARAQLIHDMKTAKLEHVAQAVSRWRPIGFPD